MEEFKIGIIGAGAIGGILAAVLTKTGNDIELVCKHSEITDRNNNEGLKVSGKLGDFIVKIPSVNTIEEFHGKKDAILIVTKAYDLIDCAKKSLKFLNDGGIIVSVQNGICIEALDKAVGADKSAQSVVTFGATMDNNNYEMTSDGGFIIGKSDNSKPQKLVKLVEILNSGFPSSISDNIMEELYSKLIVNSCITSMGAVCGLTLGEMMKIKKARNIFLDIIREAVAVADKMKLYVPPFGGKLDYYKLIKGSGLLAEFKRHLIIRIVGMKYSKLTSSSLQSLRRGKPTEIDYFSGYICKKGQEMDVATPVNDCILKMIKDIEGKKREINVENLYQI